MLRHLDFLIPLSVTLKQGTRSGWPGPGICAECGVARARCYIRHDDRPYCADCIVSDLSAAVPDPAIAQRHPDTMPVEMPYERYRAQGGTDDFELRSVVPGRTQDPRMYDRALA